LLSKAVAVFKQSEQGSILPTKIPEKFLKSFEEHFQMCIWLAEAKNLPDNFRTFVKDLVESEIFRLYRENFRTDNFVGRIKPRFIISYFCTVNLNGGGSNFKPSIPKNVFEEKSYRM
jgi:hypothetical protein